MKKSALQGKITPITSIANTLEVKVYNDQILLAHVGHIHFEKENLNKHSIKSKLEEFQQATKEGVYVWTQVKSNNQYVGSSKNLMTRTSIYLSSAYHKGQLNRKDKGTVAISRAMLKYPDFSKDWTLDIYSCVDYLLLENFCLSNFSCIYNIRRTATPGPYTPNHKPNKVGVKNPQFGMLGRA